MKEGVFGEFIADNKALNAPTRGIRHRLSRCMEDFHRSAILPWGETVTGVNFGDGWFKEANTGHFLPTTVKGFRVLLPAPNTNGSSIGSGTGKAPTAPPPVLMDRPAIGAPIGASIPAAAESTLLAKNSSSRSGAMPPAAVFNSRTPNVPPPMTTQIPPRMVTPRRQIPPRMVKQQPVVGAPPPLTGPPLTAPPNQAGSSSGGGSMPASSTSMSTLSMPGQNAGTSTTGFSQSGAMPQTGPQASSSMPPVTHPARGVGSGNPPGSLSLVSSQSPPQLLDESDSVAHTTSAKSQGPSGQPKTSGSATPAAVQAKSLTTTMSAKSLSIPAKSQGAAPAGPPQSTDSSCNFAVPGTTPLPAKSNNIQAVGSKSQAVQQSPVQGDGATPGVAPLAVQAPVRVPPRMKPGDAASRLAPIGARARVSAENGDLASNSDKKLAEPRVEEDVVMRIQKSEPRPENDAEEGWENWLMSDVPNIAQVPDPVEQIEDDEMGNDSANSANEGIMQPTAKGGVLSWMARDTKQKSPPPRTMWKGGNQVEASMSKASDMSHSKAVEMTASMVKAKTCFKKPSTPPPPNTAQVGKAPNQRQSMPKGAYPKQSIDPPPMLSKAVAFKAPNPAPAVKAPNPAPAVKAPNPVPAVKAPNPAVAVKAPNPAPAVTIGSTQPATTSPAVASALSKAPEVSVPVSVATQSKAAGQAQAPTQSISVPASTSGPVSQTAPATSTSAAPPRPDVRPDARPDAQANDVTKAAPATPPNLVEDTLRVDAAPSTPPELLKEVESSPPQDKEEIEEIEAVEVVKAKSPVVKAKSPPASPDSPLADCALVEVHKVPSPEISMPAESVVEAVEVEAVQEEKDDDEVEAMAAPVLPPSAAEPSPQLAMGATGNSQAAQRAPARRQSSANQVVAIVNETVLLDEEEDDDEDRVAPIGYGSPPLSPQRVVLGDADPFGTAVGDVNDDSTDASSGDDGSPDGCAGDDDSSEGFSPNMPPPPDLLTSTLASMASRVRSPADNDHRRAAACSGRSVRFRVVANSERGANMMVITLGPDAPLGRLMMAWCDHHSLPRRSARFAVTHRDKVRELIDTDTARALVRQGVIAAAAVPAPGENTTCEVLIRAAPRRDVRR